MMKNRYTGKTRLFLCISGAIIVVALIMQIAGCGLNLGIDFTGGSLLSYSVGEEYDINDVNKILDAAGYSGYQVTKAEPGAASIELQNRLAAEAAEAVETEEAPVEAEATAEETAEAAEATETPVEETEAPAEETPAEETPAEEVTYILDMDKSGIEADGRTDLQIRLNLVDNTEGLEDAMTAAVATVLPDAVKVSYQPITNSVIVENNLDNTYAGGYMLVMNVGAEFDSAAVQAAVEAALAENYDVTAVGAQRFDATVKTEETEEPAEETSEETSEETTEETEAVEETAEETEETEAVEETGTDLRVMVVVNDAASEVRSSLEQQMTAKYPNFRFVSIDHVSAVAGRDLLSNAVKALLIAFLCMLIYIAIRFDVFSGLAALFGLLHDVLIMASFMVFFRFLYQVNSSFIAAILTIVGYSINNTIIIFDRIRETAKKPGYTEKPRKEIVEVSVSQTISRTINTTLTTLVTLVALYIFGVDSIREFAFPLIVGMLAGTYSSVLLSGQVWASWMEKVNAKKASKKAAQKAAKKSK